jgi:large subunit ribosomal protein L19
MAAATSATAVSGVVLPHAFLSHRSPPSQVLSVASSFRRLSLCASPRRTTHIIARADASAEAGEPDPEEPVTASAESEEEVAEGAVAVAEAEEEEAEEPPPPSKPKVKFGEIIGVRISCADLS